MFLVLAVLLRLWLALRGHAIRHPDEIFQGVEQAHRLVFGYGVETVEARQHLRWPGLAAMLAVPQYLAAALGQGPGLYMPLTRIGAALLSLLPVPLLYMALRRRVDPVLAALGCLLPLMWVELVDFATSPLADALAAPLLGAMALLPLATDRRGWSWAVAFCGCAALACALRLQLGIPAVLIAAPLLWQSGGSVRVRLALAAAALLVLLAAIDVAAGIAPFADIAANLGANIVAGGADKFGVEPWYYYPLSLMVGWGPAIAVPIVLLLPTLRHHWRLSLPAVALVVALSLIPHKEPRFYFPATLLIVLSLGWATAVLAAALTFRPLGRIGLAVVVPLSTLALAWPAYVAALTQSEDNLAVAEMAAAVRPETCGVAVAAAGNIYETAGYTYLNRPLPLLRISVAELDTARPRANVVLAWPGQMPEGAYAMQQCFADAGSRAVCLYTRPGGCE